MVMGMGITSFTSNSLFIRLVVDLFFSSSLKENYKLRNLLAKVEKVLTFLSLTFFRSEEAHV